MTCWPGVKSASVKGPEPIGAVATVEPEPSGMIEPAGIAMMYLKAEFGALSVTESVRSSITLMPEGSPVGFASYSSAPAMPFQNSARPALVAGSSTRASE